MNDERIADYLRWLDDEQCAQLCSIEAGPVPERTAAEWAQLFGLRRMALELYLIHRGDNERARIEETARAMGW